MLAKDLNATFVISFRSEGWTSLAVMHHLGNDFLWAGEESSRNYLAA
jgi:hypothetical protein